MVTSPLIPQINIEDVSQKRAETFKAIGQVIKVSTKPVANGYNQFEVQLRYVNPLSGRELTFYSRINLRPEWFTHEYKTLVEQTRDNKERGLSGPLQDNELMQYDINVSKYLLDLFRFAGLKKIDTSDESELVGRVVGFKTKNQRNDPSRLEISYFFAPKKGE